jgi:hypothetical protein
MPLGANKVALFGSSGVVTDTSVLLATATTAGAASIEFTSLIDSTYKQYVFGFYKVAPITNSQEFQMITSTDGGSTYGVTTTSTYFEAYQFYTWAYGTSLAYVASSDLAQSTSPQKLTANMATSTQTAGGNNTPGANLAGELILYNPSSTTYVKHWTSKQSWNYYIAGEYNTFTSGYINTTSAINAIKFYITSGNIEGTIKMWGVL